jgi:uncharacterized protein
MGSVVNMPARNWRDTFYNLMSGLGVLGRDKFASQQYQYVPLNLSDLQIAYRGDWIARKCVDIPAFDMTRMWRSWEADQDQIEKIETVEKQLHVQSKVQQCLVKARLFGGAAMIIGVDQGVPSEELDLEAVGEGDLKWIHVVPWYQLATGPMNWDITSPYWGQPIWYSAMTSAPTPPSHGSPAVVTAITNKSVVGAQVQVHPSRVVRLLGLAPPDPLAQIWGDSILQPINDTIKAAGLVTGSLATLVSEMKVDIISIPNLQEALSTDAGTNKVLNRFAQANTMKSVINTILLDSGETWQRIQTNLGGAEQLLATYLQIASGAADIPASRFLGLPHRGLNVTGEADFRNYYDRLGSDQVVMLTPAMNKLDEVIIRSALGARPDNVDYGWNSLWQMDDVQKSQIALTKAQAFKIDADEGLIPTTALANARINQLIEDGFYPGLDQALDEAAAEGDTVEEHNRPPPPPALPPPQPPIAATGEPSALPAAGPKSVTPVSGPGGAASAPSGRDSTTDKREGDPEALREYWRQAINWGHPGDFDECVAEVGKYIDDPEGFCALRHYEATGAWPGHASGEGKKDAADQISFAVQQASQIEKKIKSKKYAPSAFSSRKRKKSSARR